MTLINSDFSNPLEWIMSRVLLLPGIILGLSIHEFGHAYVAARLGDETPRIQKRVTLNPMAHIDKFGFLCLMVAGFGWGRPVMINPQNFKNRRRDELLVAVAGVTMNLIVAIVFAAIIQVLIVYLVSKGAYNENQMLVTVLVSVVRINIVLMVFNLMPIPPLDGFSILTEIFDLKKNSWYYTFYQNGFIILMILLVVGFADKILFPIVDMVYSSIMYMSMNIVPLELLTKSWL